MPARANMFANVVKPAASGRPTTAWTQVMSRCQQHQRCQQQQGCQQQQDLIQFLGSLYVYNFRLPGIFVQTTRTPVGI